MTPRPEAFSAPIINLNGSSPAALLGDIIVACRALDEAAKALGKCAPHPRDWQTVKDGDSQFNVARDQHNARLYRLGVIHAELQAIGLSIQAQVDNRRRP